MIPTARFRVREIFEITDRGTYVSGKILSGAIRPGMRTQALPVAHQPTRFTVAAVEFVDYVSQAQADIAVAFEENPCGESLRKALPANAILEFHEPE